MNRIIEAMRKTGAQALHPGYGFLSENSHFVQRLEKEGLCFIGPSARSMDLLGDKINSKKVAREAKVSIVPGFVGEIADEAHMLRVAKEIGYPIMIKASAGGGGKGIRIASNDQEAVEGYRLSKEEASSSFGDDRMLVEKAIVNPRHIEIQLIGDKHGNLLYLPERDCSIQRRNQKVIEESPSPFLDRKTWHKMGQEAVALGKATDYYSAGTCEMMVDGSAQHYFLELNARLQVEHPVSEEVTGVDLVEQMLRCAAGLKLSIKQEDLNPKGWAMESRLYAEDPFRNYLPSIGTIRSYFEPGSNDPQVRIDSAVEEGSEISMYYDPMIAKIITKADTRAACIDKQREVLAQFVATGVRHNQSLLASIYENPLFVEGKNVTTSFLHNVYPKGYHGYKMTGPEILNLARAAAYMRYSRENTDDLGKSYYVAIDDHTIVPVDIELADHVHEDGEECDHEHDHYAASEDLQVTTYPRGAHAVPVPGEETVTHMSLIAEQRPLMQFAFNHKDEVFYQMVRSQGVNRYDVQFKGTIYHVRVHSAREYELAKYQVMQRKVDLTKAVPSPMPGRIKEVKVAKGQRVEAGQVLFLVEAMKMINVIRAEAPGHVSEVLCKEGEHVAVDQLLLTFG